MSTSDATPRVAEGTGFDFADPNSRLAPLYLRTSHVVAATFLAATFLFVSSGGVWHTDVWGHLRFGQYIVEERRLPTHEMFSGDYADQSATYINYQWLAQSGAYLVFALGERLAAGDADHRLGGGLVLLASVHALIVTLRLLLLIGAFRRLTGSLAYAVLGAALVLLPGYFYHVPILRPQVLGELGLAALLLALSSRVLGRRSVAFIVVVMVLWANAHGSFAVGFVVLGLVLAGQFVSAAWRAVQERRLRTVAADIGVQRLTAALVLSLIAAAVLNPHGIELFRSSWELSRHPNIASMNEWQPLPFNALAGGVFFGSLMPALVLLWLNRKEVTPAQCLLLAFFAWQTLAHARMTVWWTMIVVWAALPHLAAVGRRWRPNWLTDTDQLNLRKTILAIVVPVVLFLWSPLGQWAVLGDAPLGSKRVSRGTPLAAAEYLRQQFTHNAALQAESTRVVFASETAGEYLLWDLRLEPPVRVTCYTHVHLFTLEHWRDCKKVLDGEREWEAIVDRLGAQFLVFEPEEHSRLAERVKAAVERWEIVPNMGKLLVARRRAPV